jgi:hypothetical protein
MSVRIKGTTNLLEVDSNNNAYVNTPMTSIKGGFVSLGSEVDSGSVTGTRYTKELELTEDFRLRTGQDSLNFNQYFPGTALNTGIWSDTLSGMTHSVAGGFSTLNAGLSVTSGQYDNQRTYAHFPCYKQFSTFAEMDVQFVQAPVTNNRCEWGLLLAAGSSAPTDGAFFRMDSTGLIYAVLNYNGTETQSSAISASLIGVNVTNTYLIYISSTSCEYWINNILVAKIAVPVGQGSPVSSMNLPLCFRNINVAATSVAQVMKVGHVSVVLADQGTNKPWSHVVSGSGGHLSQGQTGATIGSTAIATNAAIAAAVLPTNTTAAAASTGLGGFFNVTSTYAVTTDVIISSYQVPIGSSTLPGQKLYITSVVIDSIVTTAFTGGPMFNLFSLAYGHTSVSLATTEAAAAKAPRRVPLGFQQYVVTAPVGTVAPVIRADFSAAPICVNPAEFVAIATRNIGTVLTAGVITYSIQINGYWE